jgi:hypothetical protein
VQRLQVKDINKDGIFESSRTTNPLKPEYHWRDNDDKDLNNSYGVIRGSEPRQVHPSAVNKPNDLCLGIKDIEGTQANSFFAKSHFVDVPIPSFRSAGSSATTWSRRTLTRPQPPLSRRAS